MAALSIPAIVQCTFREPSNLTGDNNAFFRFPTGNPQAGQSSSRATVSSLQSAGQICVSYLASAGATFTIFSFSTTLKGSGSFELLWLSN